MKTVLALFIIVLIGLAFTMPAPNDLKVPERKIGRAIEEVLQTSEFQMNFLDESDINCVNDPFSLQYEIIENHKLIGNVYIRRVHTCDPEACRENSSITQSTNLEDLEYFDYFMIMDTNTIIQNITVYNYQATHGHDVAKRNWLSQFIGQPNNTYFEYGENIDAISGATVSAENFTNEISYILDCLNRNQAF